MNTDRSSIELLVLRQHAERQTDLLRSINKTLWWLLTLSMCVTAFGLTLAIVVAT